MNVRREELKKLKPESNAIEVINCFVLKILMSPVICTIEMINIPTFSAAYLCYILALFQYLTVNENYW